MRVRELERKTKHELAKLGMVLSLIPEEDGMYKEMYKKNGAFFLKKESMSFFEHL